MVLVITPENRQIRDTEMRSMFIDRKKIFVDFLKWDVPVVDDRYEMDQYDNDDAIYLIATDPETRMHLSSVRILPTTRPHLLGDVFPQLCARGVPIGEDIWEISRLCTSPGLESDVALRARREVATALVEFALLFGITTYTGVAHMQWMSQVLAAGWDAAPLGLPQTIGDAQISAVRINITPATLTLFRQRAVSRFPVLEIDGRKVA